MIKWRAITRLGYREFLDKEEALRHSDSVVKVYCEFFVFARGEHGIISSKIERFETYDEAKLFDLGEKKRAMKMVETIVTT